MPLYCISHSVSCHFLAMIKLLLQLSRIVSLMGSPLAVWTYCGWRTNPECPFSQLYWSDRRYIWYLSVTTRWRSGHLPILLTNAKQRRKIQSHVRGMFFLLIFCFVSSCDCYCYLLISLCWKLKAVLLYFFSYSFFLLLWHNTFLHVIYFV